MQLAEWLKDSGMTQGAFAKLAGVTQGRISQILLGDLPSLALARRISDATDGAVAVADFISDEAPAMAAGAVSDKVGPQ